jgi:hypothetical protein
VGEAGAVVVPLVVDEDLGLVLEAAEGAAVDDAVAVALVGGAVGVGRLRVAAAARGGRALRVRGETVVGQDLRQ